MLWGFTIRFLKHTILQQRADVFYIRNRHALCRQEVFENVSVGLTKHFENLAFCQSNLPTSKAVESFYLREKLSPFFCCGIQNLYYCVHWSIFQSDMIYPKGVSNITEKGKGKVRQTEYSTRKKVFQCHFTTCNLEYEMTCLSFLCEHQAEMTTPFFVCITLVSKHTLHFFRAWLLIHSSDYSIIYEPTLYRFQTLYNVPISREITFVIPLDTTPRTMR